MRYQNADQEVIGFVVECLTSGRTVWLCTVLSTFGSSPRPKGSLFAFDEHGAKAGSLSGGCVEADLVERTLREHGGPASESPPDQCEVIVFGATPEEAGRLRLPCGGLLRISVERLSNRFNNSPDLPAPVTLTHFQEISRSLNARRPVIRELAIDPYQARLVAGDQVEASVLAQLTAKSVIENDGVFLHFLGPSYTLLLIGVSEVSKAVASMATLLDYEIIVCDPREEVIREWNVEGVKPILGMPDDVVRAQPGLHYTAILALTHDPRIDDMGLMEALTTDAFYIGALGSARSTAARRKRLLQLDLSPEQLDVLHAPVGLDIGSKTPYEIALAILAEITQKRALRVRG